MERTLYDADPILWVHPVCLSILRFDALLGVQPLRRRTRRRPCVQRLSPLHPTKRPQPSCAWQMAVLPLLLEEGGIARARGQERAFADGLDLADLLLERGDFTLCRLVHVQADEGESDTPAK